MYFTKKQKEEIEKLGLFNDFIFAKIMEEEEICKHLLELILEREVEFISVLTYQKAIKVELDYKSIRLDVYVKDGEGKIYDIEVQVLNSDNLLKRARYYASLIDAENIYAGEEYKNLKDTCIIFISPFDIFRKNECKYILKNCDMKSGKILDDGITKIFINTKAWYKCENKELREFLLYMNDKSAYIESDYMKQIDERLVNLLYNMKNGEGEDKMFVSLQNYFNTMDLKDMLKETEEQLAKNKIELEESNKRLEENRKKVEESEREVEESKREVEESKREVEESKRKVEASERKVEESKKVAKETRSLDISRTIKILKDIGLDKESIESKVRAEFDIDIEMLEEIWDKLEK